MTMDSRQPRSNTQPPIGTARRLAGFTGRGYDKGRPKVIQACWFATQSLVFYKWWLPGWLRPKLLRAFGAEIGEDVFIRHRVRVLWPWKLSIGANTWIGEDAWILNLEPVKIGANVCVSQRAFVCTGSHDAGDPNFEYKNAQIEIGDGAWLAAGSLVLAGSIVAPMEVVSAGSVRSKADN